VDRVRRQAECVVHRVDAVGVVRFCLGGVSDECAAIVGARGAGLMDVLHTPTVVGVTWTTSRQTCDRCVD
jgi:hypothetical protein